MSIEGRRVLIKNGVGFNRIDNVRAVIPFKVGEVNSIDDLKPYGLGSPSSWRILETHGDKSVRSALCVSNVQLRPYETREISICKCDTGKFVWHDSLISSLERFTRGYGVLVGYDDKIYTCGLLENLSVVYENETNVVVRSRNILRDRQMEVVSVEIDFEFKSGLEFFDIVVKLRNDLMNGIGALRFKSFSILADFTFIPWYSNKNSMTPNVGRLDFFSNDGGVTNNEFALGDFQGKYWVITCSNGVVNDSIIAHVQDCGLYGITDGWGYDGKIVDFDDKGWVEWDGGGIFGAWGDVKTSSETGTPRNCIVNEEFFKTVVSLDSRLVKVLYGKAIQQGCRHVHLHDLVVNEDDDIFLWHLVRASGIKFGRDKIDAWYRGYDPYKICRPSGFNPDWQLVNKWDGISTEHMSVDILYNTYRLTGYEWLKKEISQHIEWMHGHMRFNRYGSQYAQAARAEGWCMNAWVIADRIFGANTERYKSYAIRRLKQIVLRDRWFDHPSKAICAQHMSPNWTGYSEDVKTVLPWQHAAIGIGYMRAWEHFGDHDFLVVAEDIVDVFDCAHIPGKCIRYYLPVAISDKTNLIPADYFDSTAGIHFGDSPFGGVHQFMVSPLHWLIKYVNKEGDTSSKIDRIKKAFDVLYNKNDISKWYYGINHSHQDIL